MNAMDPAVVNIVNVVAMLHRFTSAAYSVLMIVMVMNIVCVAMGIISIFARFGHSMCLFVEIVCAELSRSLNVGLDKPEVFIHFA